MTFILNYVPQSLFAFFVDVIVCHRGSLITGSSSGHLRLWSVVGVGEMRLPGENDVYVSFSFFFHDDCHPDTEGKFFNIELPK